MGDQVRVKAAKDVSIQEPLTVPLSRSGEKADISMHVREGGQQCHLGHSISILHLYRFAHECKLCRSYIALAQALTHHISLAQ